MPIKAIYWRDPEKHRAEAKNRRRRLAKLGLSYRQQHTEIGQENYLLRQNKYRKEHQHANKLASRKYRAKIKRMFGTTSPGGIWQHKMWNQTNKINARKSALK